MTRDQVRAVVERVPLLALIDDRARGELASRFTVRSVPFGEAVFTEGEPGDAFYVVVAGRARVVARNGAGEEVSLAALGPGQHFGEAALAASAPRTATVRAADDLTLLRLDRDDFSRLLASHAGIRVAIERYLADIGIQNFLKQYSALGSLPGHALRALITELEEVPAKAGESVVRQGDIGDRFFIVRRGVLDVVKTVDGRAHTVGEVGEGECFGELALLGGAPRAATVVARSACDLYALSKAGFDRALAASPAFKAQLEDRVRFYREAGAAAGRVVEDVPAPVEVSYAPASGEPADDAPAIVAPRWRRWLRRYPFLRQHDSSDCGAASLAMITAYYGVPVGVQRLRDLANVDADGASMWSLAQAAESLGFHARGLQMGYDGIRDLALPAIVHWEGYHYIVLYEAGTRHVVVGDPALSLRRLTAEEFRKGWTGRAIELRPTARLKSTEPIKGPYARFAPLVRPFVPLLLEVLVASVILNILALGVPLFTQMLVDRVLVHRSVDLLNLMFAAMVLVALFQSLIGGVRRLLLAHVSTAADAHLMADFLRHVMALPMRFFDLRRVGDVISRVSENDKIQQAMVGTVPGVILDLVLATGYLALMAFYDVKLTLVVVAVLPLFVVLMFAFTPAIRRNRREHFARYADAWSHLIESITGIATVKATAIEMRVRSKMESLFVESLLVGKRGASLEIAYSSLAGLLQALATALFLWYGARQVLDNAMTVGQLLAFITIAGSIMTPVLRLVDAWDSLQDVRNAIDRLNDVFDAKPEESGSGPLLTLKRLDGRIRFENVSFKYVRSQDTPTLAGISIDIQPGERIALVGRSGSGKSTLAKLILGLYPATTGRVLIDGHDLRVLARRPLRRRIGVVPQEVFLFSGTVRENIALGDPDAPLDRVVRAARHAGAHEFIADMAMGYETKVGERGMTLSGGQRQRIALARALLNDPDILLLDEATSSLDTESERAIQRSLDEASGVRTTLIIAHRLSTVKDASRIFVLDKGAIVEEGTHQQLLERDGLYAHLVGQQVTQ